MASSISRSVAFLGRILSVVRPFGRRRLVIVVASMIFTAVLQLGGVASVLPFLSVAANPEGFASSKFGSFLVSTLQITDPRQLVYVTGTLTILSLVLASASTILSQIVVARYVGDLGHWLRMQLLSKYYSQPYLLLRLSQLCGPHEEGERGCLFLYRLPACATLRLYGAAFHYSTDCCWPSCR